MSGGGRGLFGVALCYQAFTLSDGALRMLVLLHLQQAGRTPLELALLLLPYEAAGVVTNLLGGWLGGRFGLKPVLAAGLLLQAAACALLAAPAAWLSLPYLMATQVLSGVAKDLAKTAAKSYVRVLQPAAPASALFRATALLTGGKNAAKGGGFFVGGALLAWAGFRATNAALAALLALAAVWACWVLPRAAGRAAQPLGAVFAQQREVQWLALARLWLFGSRDVWFAVALPLYLATDAGFGGPLVGASLAAWVIGYGVVQGLAPRLLRPTGLAHGFRQAVLVTVALGAPLLLAWAGLRGAAPLPWLLLGLSGYGVLFALCSSLHSWLVVAVAGAEATAERVGFYYAANALGRLAGTAASGWLFGALGGGAPGLGAAVAAAALLTVLAAASLLPALRGPRPA